MERLSNSREEYHISIRKGKTELDHLAFRNNLQLTATINFVQSLNIENSPPQYNFETILRRFDDDSNGIEGSKAHKTLRYIIQEMRQGKQRIKNIIVSRLPTMMNFNAELLFESKSMDKDVQNKNSAQQLTKYVFMKLDEEIKKGEIHNFEMSQLKELSQSNNLSQKHHEVNQVLYYVATAILNFEFFKQIQKSGCLSEVFKLISKYQATPEQFTRIFSATMSLFKNLTTIYNAFPDQTNENMKIIIWNTVLEILKHPEAYYAERHNILVPELIDQLLYALFIFNAFSDPLLKLQNLPLKTIKAVQENRLRRYNMYKYSLKIALKGIKYSEEQALFFMNDEKFCDMMRCSQRIHLQQVFDISMILLGLDKGPIQLKGTIVTLLLDLIESSQYSKNLSFQLLFKYLEQTYYSSERPEVRICLEKIAENIDPFPDNHKQTIAWRNLVMNGYVGHVPRYMRQPLDDILGDKEKQRQLKILNNSQMVEEHDYE